MASPASQKTSSTFRPSELMPSSSARFFWFLLIWSLARIMVSTSVSMNAATRSIFWMVSASVPYSIARVITSSAHPVASIMERITVLPSLTAVRYAFSIPSVILLRPFVMFSRLTFVPILPTSSARVFALPAAASCFVFSLFSSAWVVATAACAFSIFCAIRWYSVLVGCTPRLARFRNICSAFFAASFCAFSFCCSRAACSAAYFSASPVALNCASLSFSSASSVLTLACASAIPFLNWLYSTSSFVVTDMSSHPYQTHVVQASVKIKVEDLPRLRPVDFIASHSGYHAVGNYAPVGEFPCDFFPCSSSSRTSTGPFSSFLASIWLPSFTMAITAIA